MDRRRAAGLLLALAAWFATATAAPTASNHTALDLYDDAPDGCYYNFQHYGEGDRIMTNEPCLNCTCHNRMLMCYLRVCPFTKPIGQECTIEKRADQCCPIVTCPDVPVDLLTSTTTSPAEYGPTGMGRLDKFGCSINGKYFSEGSKVPPAPNKPCEHCYCIRNMTTCVMQECTLHVDGCTPIYHKDVCCPVRYSCDHPEDEMPLLDDLSTTVRPTPGFLLTTTTISPVTQISQDCVYDNRVFPDGALIKTEKACDHCYCMKGDIVCVVQECGTPMENEGKNCTALLPREGVCCPDTYICEGDEPTTDTSETYDFTTQAAREELTTLSEPKRTSSEGSGYRNEPDEVAYTEMPAVFEPEIEGSGDEQEPKRPVEIIPGPTPGSTDDILTSTEETYEYIPLTTAKPIQEETPERTTAGTDKEEESTVSTGDLEKKTESHPPLPITTGADSIKEDMESVTDKTQVQNIGSSEVPKDENLEQHEVLPTTSGLPIVVESVVTTEINEQDVVVSGITERDSSESQTPVTSVPITEEEKTKKPVEQDIGEKTTHKLPIDSAITSAPSLEKGTETGDSTEQSQITEEESATKASETSTTSIPIIDSQVKETTESAEQTSSVPESQHYPSSTRAPGLDDEFVTTESQEQVPDNAKETVYFEPQTHSTASTPMLEEIEKDTTEYFEPERFVTIGTQEDTSYIFSTTTTKVPSVEKDATPEIFSSEEHITEDYIAETTNVPIYDQQETTSTEHEDIPVIPIETNVEDSSKPEQYLPSTSISVIDESGRRTTQADISNKMTEDDVKVHDLSSSTTASELEDERATTEPDKGLNTIPSDLLEEEGPVSPKVETATVAQETITTEADFDTKVTSGGDSVTILSKQTTITSDTSVFREEASTLTTEPAFRKEDYSPTESQAISKLTTVAADVTEEVISTLTHDHTKSTVSTLDVPQEVATTSEPKYTEHIEETTSVKESSDAPSYESSTPEVSVSEKELGAEEETVTSTLSLEKLPETTTANQEDNEIFNEPRIPGEGDCLLNGVTYSNESIVPSSNKCYSGCKCISSIIKCDPIICSPPPEYMDNCETMYDSADACCPTYICDHKSETIPPQSQSQMSGTEGPEVSPVHCHGDECEISKEKEQPSGESSEVCKSGSCTGQSDESHETGPAQSTPDHLLQPITDQTVGCDGDKCTPSLCTDRNDCQASPVKPCDGEKCEITPDTLPQELQPCANGEDCTFVNVPTKECSGVDCVTKSEVIPPKETCSESDGCQNEPITPEECKEDSCRKKDTSPVHQHIAEPCKEPDCKPNVEISTQTSQEKLSGGNEKEASVEETETSEAAEKLDTSTESYEHSHETSEFTEPHDAVTKQPELISSDSITTISDSIELVTKLEYVPEATTKPSDTTYKQQTTSDELVTEMKQPESTDEPEFLLPVVTEPSMKEQEAKVPSLDETVTDIPALSVTAEDSIKIDDHVTETDRPQDTDIMETSKPETTISEGTTAKTSVESSTDPSTSEAQEVTESAEQLKPENITPVISEGSSETSVTQTSESYETTKLSDELEHYDITKDVAEGSGTEPPKTDDTQANEITQPEVTELGETTTKSVQESTESSKTYATESQVVTGSPDIISEEDITSKITDESITESPKPSDEFKDDDVTKEKPEESETEPTKISHSDEQVGEVDHAETVSMPAGDSGTESPTLSIEKATETLGAVEQEMTTEKITADISSEPPKSISTESQDVTTTPEDTEHRDIPSIITEETGPEPSKTYDTESQDVTKSSQEIEHEVTTANIVVEQGTELFIKPHEITERPQEIDSQGSTLQITDEGGTIPLKTDSTESEVLLVTKPSEHIPSTEPSQTFVTETQSPDEDKFSSKPSIATQETEETQEKEQQEVTKSDEETDQITTVKTFEESVSKLPETSATDQQNLPQSAEESEQIDTTPKMSEEHSTELPKTYATEQDTEQQEVTKSSEEIDQGTTVKLLEESVTEVPETLDAEPQETPKLPEATLTTAKISQESATEPPNAYTTEEQAPKSPEEIEYIGTTVRTIDQTTAPEQRPEIDSESPDKYVTESDKETEPLKPTITEMGTEKPKEDDESLNTDSESAEKITNTQELFTSESVEMTTASLMADSKITTSEIIQTEETASETPYIQEPHNTQADVDGLTVPSIKEQGSTTSRSADNDIAITELPAISDSEQTPIESITEQHKPDFETQTASSGLGEVSEPDLQEVLTTQQPTIAEHKIPERTDTEIQVPVYVPTDELSTTLFDIQDVTTMKPTDASQAPHDMEIKTEYPEIYYTPHEEHPTEDLLIVSQQSTEQSLIDTENPAISEEEIKTDKPKETVSVTPERSSEVIPTQEENYTVESVTRFDSSPQTTTYESTKAYLDEDIRTEEPMFHESKEPVKPIDDLVQSLITEQYEISTKPSDLEKDSQTEISIQISSATLDSDTTKQINAIEKITTPPTKVTDTTISEPDIKSESTEHENPVELEIRTESSIFVDTTNEPITQQQHLSDEDQIHIKPVAPEQNEFVTSTDTEHKLTTEHPDTTPSISVVTDTIAPFVSIAETQEFDKTDKPSIDMQTISTESSPTTEAAETKATSSEIQLTSILSQDHTESNQEVTKSPDVQIQEQTEPSEAMSAESPETPSGAVAPMPEPVHADTISTDLKTTEAPEPSREQPVLTTLEPSVENDIPSASEVTSKHEYPEKTTTPSETTEHTDKIKEESKATPSNEELTTEQVKVTETTLQPEDYTEKQADTVHIVTPEKEAPEIEVLHTTRQPLETEIYETTLPIVEDIPEKSTHSPIKSEEESTSVHDISPVEPTIPEEDQSIPVISDVEKISTPEGSAETQTDRFTPASEKPSHEITVPEEEFLLATKSTTVKAEKEITTDKPAEAPVTIASKESFTTAPEVSVTAAPKAPITKTPEVPVTTATETLLTTAPEVPVTTVPEAPATKAPEVPITTAPETAVTKAPEAPITAVPEASATAAPEAPATVPELPKPVSTEVQPTDEVPTPDDEGSFPPSGGTSGYGQDTDYVEEDQTFGPGTCRYGGKVYVSAQQIPRDDPCDFCFCFRSDIICLQQSCPPPIHGCHEEPIQGFCCPRYECPVSMATTVNVTTTTTTTTTTLPPNFPTHSYKGSAQRRGCQIKGQTYKVGDVVRASSGPCLHCTCGGDGQMKCDPKVCTPEPMLRQMIAAAVSAKRRR